MQQEFDSLKAFDFQAANVHLWIFKKSASANSMYSAHYAQTDDALNAMLRGVVRDEMTRLTEFSPYSYLAENNENSCLAASIVDTEFPQLKAMVDRPEPDWRLNDIKQLKNAGGYVAKYTHNGQTVYAVKRSAPNWKASYRKSHINILYRNGELSAIENDAFSIEKTFDFYAINNTLFIASKRAFESVLEHRKSYTAALGALTATPQFVGLFTDVQPLVTYVGTNSIQLRRMAKIEQRALYTQPNFLTTLKTVNAHRNWGLNFDAGTGQLIPCATTARTIMQVLLDHRLLSEVTAVTYDVPDATQV